jgi:hypothetical protein
MCGLESSGQDKGWTTNKSWSYPLYGQETFIFSELFQNHSGARSTSYSMGIWSYFSGIRRPEREADHSLLVPRLQMRGFTRPLPSTPSWRVEIYRLAYTIFLRGGTNTSVLPAYSVSALERETWALTLLQQKQYRRRYEPHTAELFRQEV